MTKTKNLFISLFLAATVLPAALFANGSHDANTEKASAESQTLNIAVFEGGYGPDYWNEIVAAYEEANPGVTVNMQISPRIGDIIRPQIVSGSVPDFISMNDNDQSGLIAAMIKEKTLLDITDAFELKAWDSDMTLKDQILDGILESSKASPYGDGKIYLAPFNSSPMGMVYNKTLFEKKGWDVPVTWNDFFALGAKAKAEGYSLFTYAGIYPVTWKAFSIRPSPVRWGWTISRRSWITKRAPSPTPMWKPYWPTSARSPKAAISFPARSL
nr:extracellular solute-binding protein [uncultured Sphaerochaeta sp.]